ncbi:MAG: hypothetical protein COV45_09130 [Deltaproteobacteria bacterium CG11_big_fil_rev_8_21_14_0_20_47_16]|nr:MAG: hypothetical protein COV45_09130 [Deltaproteobacteria bacterium CG11_big_fil_rev_8_21_14_0_20_47_16]
MRICDRLGETGTLGNEPTFAALEDFGSGLAQVFREGLAAFAARLAVFATGSEVFVKEVAETVDFMIHPKNILPEMNHLKRLKT